MYRFLVNIFVCFIPKRQRARTKYNLLGLPNRIRIKKKAISVGKNFECSGTSRIRVNKKTIIKDEVHINGISVYGSGALTIGNYVHIGEDCAILTDNHNYEGECIPYDNTVIEKPVEIGDFVWIGTRVTILPGTKIGEGAIIQAGAVVHGEIPPYAIAGGNPAKVFSSRDKAHFLKLKEEKKFWSPR